MTYDDFLGIIDRVLGNEAGYVNNPNDPGGETKWGISKRSYPKLDIKNLTKAQAIKIYYEDFWLKLGTQDFHKAIAYQLLDFAVNSSNETAIRALQRVIGVVDDGHFGPISRTALQNISDTDLIMLLLAERLEYMTKLNNWNNAGKGWARRIARNLRYGAEDS